jgi:hypothetical protein
MPLTGTRDVTSLAAGAPLLPSLGTGPWQLAGAEILQVLYEAGEASITSLIPPALHPTIPATLYITIMRVPESSVGPFTLAEVRAGCRAGARPRGFLARAYCDSETAIAELRNRWGYPVAKGGVSLNRSYDRTVASVSVSGRPVLECGLVDPEPIGGGDIQYIASMNLARVVRDGSEVVRLIQVDPEYTFHKADRGKPRLSVFDGNAWGLPGAQAVYPVSASFAVCDVVLPEIRYIADPSKPPLQAIEKV